MFDFRCIYRYILWYSIVGSLAHILNKPLDMNWMVIVLHLHTLTTIHMRNSNKLIHYITTQCFDLLLFFEEVVKLSTVTFQCNWLHKNRWYLFYYLLFHQVCVFSAWRVSPLFLPRVKSTQIEFISFGQNGRISSKSISNTQLDKQLMVSCCLLWFDACKFCRMNILGYKSGI